MQLIHSIYTLETPPGHLSVDDDRVLDLYGYSITMDGRVVVQQFVPEIEDYIGDDLTWEDLQPVRRTAPLTTSPLSRRKAG